MKNIIKRALALLMVLAMTLQFTVDIGSLSVFAADEAVTTEETAPPQTEEKKEEPKEEQKEEKKEEKKEEAPAVKEEPQKETAETPAQSDNDPVVKEEKTDAVSEAGPDQVYEANANQVNEAKAVPEETKEEEPAPKPEPPKTIYVVYHFMQMDSDGSYSEAKSVKKSVTAGKSTANIALSTAKTYVKNKSVTSGGKTLKFINTWKEEGGSAASFPLSMSYEKAADLLNEGNTVDVNLYAQYRSDVKITLHFNEIRLANGGMTSAETSNTLSWGSGWSITQKKLESTTGLRAGQSFASGSVIYTYNGVWKDSSGNTIDPSALIQMKVGEGTSSGNIYYFTEDSDLTFVPVYETRVIHGLDLFYSDNISTGSGSWTNSDAAGNRSSFDTMSHKFSDPSVKTPVDHYRFVDWKNPETGDTYGAGDKFTFTAADHDEDVTVKIYARWQPSVTVNYHDIDGKLAGSAEKFESISAYDGYTAADIENADFIGWYTEDGVRVAEGTEYTVPGITVDPVERKVIDLYARYTTSYTIRHSLEALDGSFAEKEDATEIIADALIGSTVSAAASTFEGFTFDETVEGTLTEAVVQTGLVLNFFYTRNSYTVSYGFTGDIVPENIAAPEAAEYKFEQEVKAAAAPEAAGYVFSGWSEVPETMPAHDVKVTGSWDYADDVLTYNANGGSGSMAASAGKTFNDVTVSGNGFARNGYTFEGWNTAADGSGKAYEAGSSFTLTTGDDVLFAQWKVIPAPAAVTENTDTPEASDPAPSQPQTRPDRIRRISRVRSAAPAAVIADSETPAAASFEGKEAEAADIEDTAAPLAAPERNWALLNLIAMIAAAVGAIIASFRRKEENEDEDDADENDDNRNMGRVRTAKAAGLLAGAAAVIAFFLTEDMTLPMVLTDRWTILMIIILAVQAVSAALVKKACESDEEDEEADAVAAEL